MAPPEEPPGRAVVKVPGAGRHGVGVYPTVYGILAELGERWSEGGCGVAAQQTANWHVSHFWGSIWYDLAAPAI